MAAVLAQGSAFDFLGIIIFGAIFIGSLILRARAEARARERRAAEARKPEGRPPRPEQEAPAIPPPLREIMRQIGLEPASPEPPVARPLGPESMQPPGAPATGDQRRRPAPSRPSRRRPRPAAPVPPGPAAGPRPPAPSVAAARPAAVSAAGELALEPTGEPDVVAPLRSALDQDLAGGPLTLRKAILFAEILGPPRAVRPLEERLGLPPAG